MLEKTLGQKLREVGVHTVIYGIGSVAQTLGAFLLIPLLTAHLSPEQFGAYSLIQLAGTIAAAIFYFGVTSSLPRSYFDYPDEEKRKVVFSTSFFILCFGLILQTAFGALFQKPVSNALLGTDFYGREVFWSLFSSGLIFVNQAFFTFIRLKKDSLRFVAFSVISLVLLFPIAYVLINTFALGLLAPFLAIAIVQGVLLLCFLILYGRRALTLSVDRREAKIMLGFGIPIVFANLAVMMIDWVDRLFLEHYVSLAAVGIYSLGYRLGSLINAGFISPFVQIWNPLMLEYRSHANFKSFASKLVSYYFLFGTFLCLSAVLFSRDVFKIFVQSSGYESAEPIFWVILYSYLAYGFTNIVVAGLFFERKGLKLALVYYFVAALNIGLNFYFIPRFGISGAAGTTAVSYVLIPFMIYLNSRGHFEFDFERTRLVRLAVIHSVFLASVLLLHDQMHFLVKAFVFLIYCGVSYRFLLLNEERNGLKHAFAMLKHRRSRS